MKKTALLFAGQGAQVVGMGRDLADRFPAARRLFEEANETLGYDLSSLCFSGPEAELVRTENAQPGIYLVSWVAFEMLRQEAGECEFAATAGLSLGEFTALAVAGGMGLADGLRLVRLRGRCMQEACEETKGGMAAIIGLSEEKTGAICRATGVELANLNCPGQQVISGPWEAVEKACDQAKQQGAKRALPLAVAGAYHSRLMGGAVPKLEHALAETSMQEPAKPVISNVTARPHGSVAEIRRQLAVQVTSSVRWEASMRYLLDQGFERFIELGPGTALSGFMKRIDRGAEILNVADVPSLETTMRRLSGG